jgi:hypothetical protein
MEEDMKTLCQGVILAVVVVCAVGCMDEGDSDGVGDETIGAAVTADVTPTAAEVAMWSDATGERISAEESGPSITGGCAHIQWCNEPGPWGTICIWDACDIITASKECAADARAVCGRTIPPIDIR